MAFEFRLPDIGEGISEGEVVKWLVKEGDTVKEEQPIVEIMTDKATVEIASPISGTIQKRMAEEGKLVGVGKVLVLIEDGSSGNGKTAPKPESKPAAPQAAVIRPSPAPAPAASPSANRPFLASPATRRMAREHGVDLINVPGSGPLGRVTAADLASKLGKPGDEERIPLKGIRKKIAEHMVKARNTAVHFTQVDEADMTALVELRRQASAKITYLPFIVRALCAALKEFPALNGSLDDEKQEIVLKHYYNIGIAVQTESGLVVPVVKNADRKSVMELAQEIQALAEKARSGKLSVEDFQGGTFTVTSTGGSGTLFATPIINHPELGILGVGRIQETPVVRDGRVVIRHMGYLSLSLDHRVVDGAVGAAFLKRLVEYVEQPALMCLDAQ
jgi:pyruvate dehydrogenase E2 component (dihydrolipoamide acetyltransferase)